MVRLVSAIEVASTTLRRPAAVGAIAASWAPGSSAPYSGWRSTPASRVPCRRSCTARISPTPGRNTSSEPGWWASAWRTAAATVSGRRCSRRGGRYSTSTGWLLPALVSTGASSSSAASGSASSVADITITRRSGLSACCDSRTSARPRSASSERSWNSSNSTAATPPSSGSRWSMRTRMPSVTTSMRVRAETLVSTRVRKPTVVPTGSPRDFDMNRAAARAARRRGSSTRSFFSPRQSAFSSASGTRVVLPAPGGACSTAVDRSASVASSRGSRASIGSSGALRVGSLAGMQGRRDGFP